MLDQHIKYMDNAEIKLRNNTIKKILLKWGGGGKLIIVIHIYWWTIHMGDFKYIKFK